MAAKRLKEFNPLDAVFSSEKFLRSNKYWIYVPGVPRAQPRIKAFARGNHAHVYTPQGPHQEWKQIVKDTAKKVAPPLPLKGAIEINLTFFMPRPKSHYRTGKNSNKLKDNAPKLWHIQKPDKDNLEKLVLDALKEIEFFHDDCQICIGSTKKLWANDTIPGGAIIEISSIDYK